MGAKYRSTRAPPTRWPSRCGPERRSSLPRRSSPSPRSSSSTRSKTPRRSWRSSRTSSTTSRLRISPAAVAERPLGGRSGSAGQRELEEPLHQAVEVDAGGLRGLGKQAGLGEARDRIGLEDEELAAGLQHEIDAGEAVAAQEAVGAEGQVIRLLRRTFGELGRADEGGATDLVARLEVVEVLVLRNGFDHG